jgi:hypothetical protein
MNQTILRPAKKFLNNYFLHPNNCLGTDLNVKTDNSSGGSESTSRSNGTNGSLILEVRQQIVEFYSSSQANEGRIQERMRNLIISYPEFLGDQAESIYLFKSKTSHV